MEWEMCFYLKAAAQCVSPGGTLTCLPGSYSCPLATKGGMGPREGERENGVARREEEES
jgi:hypothetical protein